MANNQMSKKSFIKLVEQDLNELAQMVKKYGNEFSCTVADAYRVRGLIAGGLYAGYYSQEEYKDINKRVLEILETN